MMKKYLLLGCIILSQFAFAQWTTITSGTTADLNDVYFFDADTGFVVGDGLTLKKTVNGGNTWTNCTINASSVPSSSPISAVSFNKSKTVGIAIGDFSLLNICLRTTDGGNSWNVITVFAIANNNNFTGLSWADDTTVYMCGDSVSTFKSIDGGLTWNPQPPSGHDIFFTSADTGFGVQNGIGKTIDGYNWNYVFTGGGKINFKSVFAINADSVFAVGYTASDSAYLVNTYNGGTAWFAPLYMGVEHLNDIFFADRFTGYAVGGSPTVGSNSQYIAKTTDGGYSWVQQNEATQKELNAVFFTDALTGFAVGANGTIIKTTNGGVTGIAEKAIDNSLSLFPNPVNDFLQVKLESNKSFSYRIMDVNGKEISKGEMKNADTKINCTGLLPGNYVLLIQQEEKLISGQFIKQ